MFIIGLMSVVGSTKDLAGLTADQLANLPYYNYLIPMVIGAAVAMIGTLIDYWNHPDERDCILKQERLWIIRFLREKKPY